MTVSNKVREILTQIVEPIVGKQCKTKDTHDFPDMVDSEGRCPVCLAYEDIDEALEALLSTIENKVIGPDESLKPQEPGPRSMTSLIRNQLRDEMRNNLRSKE